MENFYRRIEAHLVSWPGRFLLMNNCLKPLLAISTCLITSVGFSQNPVAFTPFAANTALEQSLLDGVTKRFQQDLAGLNGSNKKYLADIYKERHELIRERFSEKEVLCDREAQDYLMALAREIFRANPSLDTNGLRILFSRSYYANASSMGEGTIFFNIGLFHRLENESQAAFVLCHELAHYLLNHSNNNIHQYVSTVYSEEFQRKLKSIQKSGYGQNSQLETLGKNLLFKNRRHGREFEHAADSMAVELLKNTRFDLRESLNSLALLDSADKDKYAGKLALEKQLQLPSFAFQKSWLESDDLRFGSAKDVQDKQEADSLKTHPDCSKRIEALKPLVARYAQPGARRFAVDEAQFQRLKTQFDYEVVAYCFQSRQVSKSLYYALQGLQVYPDDVYLTTMVGKSLNEIYSHQKSHELDKIVDRPSPHYGEEYNAVLRMLQNMRLQEIAAFSYYFLNPKEPLFRTNEEFNKTFSISKEHFQAPGLHRF
jgi:Zn-dependent protease with chaperone function